MVVIFFRDYLILKKFRHVQNIGGTNTCHENGVGKMRDERPD
jgi:hypothetical protein